MIKLLHLRDERNTKLREKIINNQSFDIGIRFKEGKDRVIGLTSKQAQAEQKANNDMLGMILREIKNVKGQQDKIKEEICGRQNNLVSELSHIKSAIKEVVVQEERRAGTRLEDRPTQNPQPPCTWPHWLLTVQALTQFKFKVDMKGVCKTWATS